MFVWVEADGLILFNRYGKIFLIKELQSKPNYEKKSGMLSIPIETIKAGETKDEALKRLIYEEIGEPIDYKMASFFNDIRVVLNDSYGAHIQLYTVTYSKDFTAKPNDTDIIHYGFEHPCDIFASPEGRFRMEMKPILKLIYGDAISEK